ncbi:zinc-binding dehydrogenase [Streptomyces rishiriensis]|uniref:zinc-binding dehydrogenase n=1 Tax=Streptomyces rishiriensis TaxID=68264 RepID=UPI0027D9BF8A|nr:zinc-binding dehydrogenase [Streptomyces rishiriensis]
MPLGVITYLGSVITAHQPRRAPNTGATPSQGAPPWLEKSLTVLKPGGLAVSVVGPPDAGFAKQLGAPSFMGLIMNTLSRKVRKQAKSLGVRYEFFFMQANGSQLRKLAALYDSGELRPVIDRTFPFDRTLEAMAYVEQGRTKAGKVVVSMAPDNA